MAWRRVHVCGRGQGGARMCSGRIAPRVLCSLAECALSGALRGCCCIAKGLARSVPVPGPNPSKEATHGSQEGNETGEACRTAGEARGGCPPPAGEAGGPEGRAPGAQEE